MEVVATIAITLAITTVIVAVFQAVELSRLRADNNEQTRTIDVLIKAVNEHSKALAALYCERQMRRLEREDKGFFEGDEWKQ